MSFDEMVDKQIQEVAAETQRDSSNWQIRVEALRAAAVASGGKGSPESLIALAKIFERYLETGE